MSHVSQFKDILKEFASQTMNYDLEMQEKKLYEEIKYQDEIAAKILKDLTRLEIEDNIIAKKILSRYCFNINSGDFLTLYKLQCTIMKGSNVIDETAGWENVNNIVFTGTYKALFILDKILAIKLENIIEIGDEEAEDILVNVLFNGRLENNDLIVYSCPILIHT
jgi:hypothetical protein